MTRIVALSSFVARGHVGLGALLPPLEALQHDVAALPTVVFSNHAGCRQVAGFEVDPQDLYRKADALAGNGWLEGAEAVVTGYLPTPAHVAFAVSLVTRVRAKTPKALFVCDPILGDEPKGLYIPQDAAEAIRHELLPLADLCLPNVFELGWLSGQTTETFQDIVDAARGLPCPRTVVTSVPRGAQRLGTVLVEADQVLGTLIQTRENVPHGTGDVLAGLITAYMAAGAPVATALARGGAILKTVILASAGRDDLFVQAGLEHLSAVVPLPLEAMS